MNIWQKIIETNFRGPLILMSFFKTFLKAFALLICLQSIDDMLSIFYDNLIVKK